jgi:hypothetical protein
MEIMVDRTAHGPGWIWDFGTAYRVARALEEIGAVWLEEPFQRGEVHESARLNEVVDIPITGGEGDYNLEIFRDYLKYDSFEILQPDAFSTLKKLAPWPKPTANVAFCTAPMALAWQPVSRSPLPCPTAT